MFADDSKCLSVINTIDDCVKLQSDLDNLYQWVAMNKLDFQIPKCHNLRISRKRSSLQREYSLCGQILEIVPLERDLGVMVSKDTGCANIYRQWYLKLIGCWAF